MKKRELLKALEHISEEGEILILTSSEPDADGKEINSVVTMLDGSAVLECKE
jgi:hypothetical protein